MKQIVFTVAMACALASCGSIETISYDQLNPAAYSFPNEIKDIAVINHMPPVGEAKSNVMTLEDTEGDGKASTEALAEALANSRFFSQVMICDSALYESNQTEQLPKETVTELTNSLKADMLVSLDRVLIQKQKTQVLYPGMNAPWPVVRVKVTPVVRLYMYAHEKPVRVIAQDSLEWNVDEVISDKDMLKEAASFAAHIVSQKLVPYWTNAQRLYYTGGTSEMRDASVWAKENNWEKAYDIWNSLFTSSKSDKVKLKAAFNLALASEMMGQIEEAEQWLDKAQQLAKAGTNEEQVCKYYSVQLEKRKNDYARLDAQMNRFAK